MNREILFRGKRVDNGEWVEGSLLKSWTDTKDMYAINKWPYDYNIDYATVGQYTGLADKNGKKIFEGDIIKTHYKNAKNANFVEQVVFENGRFCALAEISGGKMWSSLPDGIVHINREVYMSECEVIGNIHDNPELLEVGK